MNEQANDETNERTMERKKAGMWRVRGKTIARKHIDMLFTKGFMYFSCDAHISQTNDRLWQSFFSASVFSSLYVSISVSSHRDTLSHAPYAELPNRIRTILRQIQLEKLKQNAIKVHV